MLFLPNIHTRNGLNNRHRLYYLSDLFRWKSYIGNLEMVFCIKDTPQYMLYHYIAEIIRGFVRWLKQVMIEVEDWVALYNGFAESDTSIEPVVIEADPAVVFYEKRKTKLLASYSSENGVMNWNSSISPVFYDKQKYKSVLEEYNNDLERQWKTRVLLETTPRGNVLMYFDPYKMGFAYFSDHYVPYNILNAIAMRYVLVFRCRDFFTDEFVIPETHPSPLLELRRVEDKKKEDGNRNGGTSAGSGTSTSVKDETAPFAKLKSYNKSTTFSPAVSVSAKSGIGIGEKSSKPADKLQLMNAFVYLGKMCNYSVLPKISKQNALNGFATRFDVGKKISWSEFKQNKNHAI